MENLLSLIEKSIENNSSVDFATSEELTSMDLDTVVFYNKIWIYQVFSKKYVRF